jgi:hypothetical protein
MNRKFVVIAAVTLFLVLFNLGYVFHDLLMGAWLHEQEAAIAREEFIIPLIAAAFLAYSVVLAYLFPIYRSYYARSPLMPTAIGFGILMGFVWDALQGGIIEVATFNMPFAVFLVDSGYHVFIEGTIAGVILGVVASKWPPVLRGTAG